MQVIKSRLNGTIVRFTWYWLDWVGTWAWSTVVTGNVVLDWIFIVTIRALSSRIPDLLERNLDGFHFTQKEAAQYFVVNNECFHH